jgi:hypothetical protein
VNSMTTETIFVYLLDEGVDCWRPVDAVREGDYYRIVSVNEVPDDEQWQFSSGDLVACEDRELSKGRRLVAVRRIDRG